MSISINNISKFYGEQKALDNISLEINPGEILGLLGPNGAGKSTLMKIITCFIPPSEGNVSVYGYDIFEESIEVRKKVGYLPENNPLYLEMYIKEYLEFVAGIHKIPGNKKERVKEMISMTGLEPEQHKKIAALSKGFRQRVGLAQALIHDPEVLILDEPTSGLDPNQLIEIRNLITEIGKHKTIMLSTHIMQEVEAICSRSVIINKGVLVADDATENLIRSMKNRDVITVEFAKVIDPKGITKITGVSSIKNLKENTWIIESSSEADIRQLIFNFAVETGNSVLTMSREEQRLEDVFQALTRN